MAEECIVGRESLLASVGGLLRERRPVVLTGHAGVGKSRLGRELVGIDRQAGSRVVEVRGNQASQEVPLGAFAFLIEPKERPELDIASALWGLQTALLGDDGRSATIYVDDAHLLDPVSVMLVNRIARASDARLLLTVRQGEARAPGIVDLWSDGTAERVVVDPLERSALEEMVANLIGNPLSPAAADEFWRLSEGNPLCARELLDEANRSGSITTRSGQATLTRPLVAGAQTHELIEARLAALPQEEATGLRLLATAGRLPLALLERALGSTAVGALERRGLVTIEGEGMRRSVVTSHPLYGEVMGQAMGDDCRRTAFTTLFEAVQGVPMRRSGDAVTVAEWGLRAEQAVDPQTLATAAGEALTRHSPRQAERFARAAGKEDPRIGVILGNALAAQGRADEAAEVFEGLLGTVDDDGQRAEIGMALASMQGFSLKDFSGALTTLARIEGEVSDIAARDMIAAQRAALSFCFINTETALREIQPVVERDPPANEDALLSALGAGITAAGLAGRVTDAREYGRRATEILRDRTQLQVQHIGMSVMMQAWGLAQEGAAAEGLERLHEARDRFPGLVPVIDCGVGVSLTHCGFHERSRVVLNGVIPGLTAIRDPMGQLAWAEAAQVENAAFLGDWELAASVDERLAERPPPEVLQFGVEVLRCRGVYGCLRGPRDEGMDLLRRSLAEGERTGQYTLSVLTLDELTRFGAAAEAAPLARAIAERAEPAWVIAHGVAAHAEARLAEDAAALAACASDYAAWGWILRAAEISADASLRLVDEGRLADALREDIRSRRWQSRLGTLASPLLAPRRPILGKRAHEIAGLVAAGMSNRAIADRLVLSPRTVENHLYRAYTLLEIDGRDELARLFTEATASAVDPTRVEEILGPASP